METTLAHKTIRNIGYSSIAKVATFLLRTAASIILARNLSASDYGVVGFAMVVIGFLSRFNDIGIGAAVVQRADLDDKTIQTAFWIRLALGVFLLAVSMAGAPLAWFFFDHPDVGPVIKVLSIGFVVSAFSFLPDCLLARGLEFKKLSVATLCSATVRSLLAIGLVFLGFKYWSLVWAELGALLTQALALNVLHKVKVRWVFDRQHAAKLMSFGAPLFVSGIFIFLIFNADNIVIGAVAGATMLGFYALAFNWATIACGVMSEAVHSVLFPTFSSIQNEPAAIRKSYLKVLEYCALLGVMVNVNFIVSAREILVFVLGHGTEKWLPAVPALQILAIYGIVRIILEPVGNVVLAFGKPRVLLKATVLAGVFEILGLYPAVRYGGIEAVAALVLFSYATQYGIYLHFLKKKCAIAPMQLFSSIAPSLAGGVVVVVTAGMAANSLGFSISSLVLKTLYCTGGCFVIHGLLTRWRIYKEARSLAVRLAGL
jgi:O-antigen/teichoic acid export membrane protein